ncbi:type 1 glutamine amidotransferase family protein [Sinorhizobium sp. BG8]|uniref:type 1 glutamine amidotransferase family protein n=1 Tax=Sinorhizobium sp. BG8 TaxID=2613773 RepID=UPI00193D7F0F|nr:type 1 glutamine amidotransferase family protein [Sinorhizobium sp. BG8]QRM54671.1 glutamine amidotransferase [Sinorhizobium sp. BG8]
MARRLAIGLTEGFADWECGLLMASARTFFGFEVIAATPGGQPVTSMGGLGVSSTGVLESVTPLDFDALVLAGGTIWETPAAPELTASIHAFRDTGRPIAAICGATLALARAGVLDDREHTSNAPDFLAGAEGYSGQKLYREVPHAVSDRNVITAPGTAPITFTAEVYRALGFEDDQLSHYIRLYGAEHQSAAER